MYPHERSLVKEYANKPFALLGVNSDKDLPKLRGVVKAKSLTWRSFWNGPEGTGGPISAKWNVSGWPTVYLIDHKGIIRHKSHGQGIDKVLEELIKAAESDER